MANPENDITPEHEIIIKHLRKSRELGKQILETTPMMGSALISHKFKLTTFVDDRIEMITEIDFLPSIRLYKPGQNTIVDDEDILKEDIENVAN